MRYPEFLVEFFTQWKAGNSPTPLVLQDLKDLLHRQCRHSTWSTNKKDYEWNRMLDLGEDVYYNPTDLNIKLFYEEACRCFTYLEAVALRK